MFTFAYFQNLWLFQIITITITITTIITITITIIKFDTLLTSGRVTRLIEVGLGIYWVLGIAADFGIGGISGWILVTWVRVLVTLIGLVLSIVRHRMYEYRYGIGENLNDYIYPGCGGSCV